jgi:hypothetical protein
MGRIIVILITVLATVFILGACAKPTVTPVPEPALVPVPSPTPTEPKTVAFADKNLETAIREAIGKPEGPILTSELEELTTLSAHCAPPYE